MGIYALGPFRLDTSSKLLLRGTEPIALGRRATALLQALIERSGALVSKDALIEAAWPGQAVEDSNLSVQIAALRRVFAEAPGGGHWIDTMPRRGYRFIGPVVSEVEPGFTPSPRAEAAPEPTPTPHDEPERRQIIALSCELISPSGGIDGADLEDMREALSVFRRCVSDTVDRHEGFVVNCLGNTALVLFGYPAAREHDAEEAIRAGLELCAAVRALGPEDGAPRGCRVGIATGLAIIDGRNRSDEPGDLGIIGNVPILAAQLRLSAQPGTLAIDAGTRQLIGNLFDCRDLDAIDGNAGSEPVRRWRVLGESVIESRFEALHPGPLTPLVGREEEIDLLLRRWQRVKKADGQVVLVSGEAGLGKSRITVELQMRLQSEPHLRLRYFCSPHHQDSALFPVIDQLGRAAGFTAHDSPEVRLDKLVGLLAPAAPPDEDIALLADLLSLPPSARHPLPELSPQRKREGILRALLRQLEGLARDRPVLVVFEDAHWIDPTSSELLDLTIGHIHRLPVLLVVTFRPEFQPPWIGQPQVSTLALNRLDRRDRNTLIEQIAGDKALPTEIVDQIAERTDGVPLFVEELAKSILESGVLRAERDRYVIDRALPPLAIPATLNASLLARLDRLPSVRRVAQIGAVIGREFSYSLLRVVSRLTDVELQESLARLVGSGLVLQRGAPPDAVYRFKHALVQDAAHGTLLRHARQQLHAQVAEALEAQSLELMDAQPEIFAQHYAEAGLIEKSLMCWRKAGEKSVARSAMAEAAGQFQKGLDLLALLPDDPEHQKQQLELWGAMGAALHVAKGNAAPEVSYAYACARKLWERLGFPFEFLHIPYGQWRNQINRGEIDVALRLAEDMLNLGDQRKDDVGRILGHTSLGRGLLLRGRFVKARLHYKKAIDLYDPISRGSLIHLTAISPQLESRAYLGFVLFCLGFLEQAWACSSGAIAEARRLGHRPSLAVMLSSGAGLHALSGDDGTMSAWSEELSAVTAEWDYPLWAAFGGILSGWSKVRAGDVAQGRALLLDGLKAYRATGAMLWLPQLISLFARTCEIAGQIEEAMMHLHEALQIVGRTGECWLEAELHRLKGELLLRQENPREGEESYRQALSIAVDQDAKLWELRAAVSLARLCRDQGRRSEARELLTPVYGWFTEGFDTADLKQARALLDELV